MWVKQLAQRSCHIDGVELKKGESTLMKADSTLSLGSAANLRYSLMFVVPAEEEQSVESPAAKRRKVEEDSDKLPFRVSNPVEQTTSAVTSTCEAEEDVSSSDDEIERKLASMKQTLNSQANKVAQQKHQTVSKQEQKQENELVHRRNVFASCVGQAVTSQG